MHQGKNKVAQNEKRKKLHGFSQDKTMANFEAFCQNFSLSINPQIVRSGNLDLHNLKPKILHSFRPL